MSVITYTNDQFQKLFNTLVSHSKESRHDTRIQFLDPYRVEFNANHYYNDDKEMATKLMIASFVKTLFYCNQLAASITYELAKQQPATIIPIALNEPSSQAELYTIPDLIKFMSSVEYNCITNGGTNTMTKDVEEHFRIIVGRAGTILARKEIDNGENH